MGKVLIITGADFSKNKIKNINVIGGKLIDITDIKKIHTSQCKVVKQQKLQYLDGQRQNLSRQKIILQISMDIPIFITLQL